MVLKHMILLKEGISWPSEYVYVFVPLHPLLSSVVIIIILFIIINNNLFLYMNFFCTAVLYFISLGIMVCPRYSGNNDLQCGRYPFFHLSSIFLKASKMKWDLMFSQQWRFKLSSGFWHSVELWYSTNCIGCPSSCYNPKDLDLK